jgi:hypothetical protein
MRRKRDVRSIDAIAALGRDPRRGKAFWWLYDSYAEIRRLTAGKRIPWQELEKKCAELGLENGVGELPSAENLRHAFSRVQQLKTREARAADQRASNRKPVPKHGPPPVAHSRPQPMARSVA